MTLPTFLRPRWEVRRDANRGSCKIWDVAAPGRPRAAQPGPGTAGTAGTDTVAGLAGTAGTAGQPAEPGPTEEQPWLVVLPAGARAGESQDLLHQRSLSLFIWQLYS